MFNKKASNFPRFIQIYIFDILHASVFQKYLYWAGAYTNVWQVRTSSRDGTLGTVLGQWKQSHWWVQAIQVASLAAKTVEQSSRIHRERIHPKVETIEKDEHVEDFQPTVELQWFLDSNILFFEIQDATAINYIWRFDVGFRLSGKLRKIELDIRCVPDLVGKSS